jgi:L-2,4-diaminobutyrate transaminase
MSLRLADSHLLHPFTAIVEHEANGPHFMQRAAGIHVYDAEGRQYIDAMAGLWCVNVGYGRTEIAEAMSEQSGKLAYYHSFMSLANEPAVQLADQLAGMAPGSLNHAFFCNSGSEANDTQVKIVWYYNNLRGRPAKKKIISRLGAYHGVTVAAASLSGLPNLHAGFDLPLDERFLHVGRPSIFWEMQQGETELQYSARLAAELEQRIIAAGPETIAAFIAEPVMGAGGVLPPPAGYFDAIVPVLRKYDVLLIADEVICGFGRLGHAFGSNLYGLQPDLMTLAKGLTSGYAPMSACLVSDEIYEVLKTGSPTLGPFAHGYTYTAHPVSAVAALKNLEIMQRENLFDNAAQVGVHFHAALRDAVANHPLVGDVRGFGLIGGVELIKDKARKIPFDPSEAVARRLYKLMLTEGLIARPIQNMIAFAPPLILSNSDADQIIARFTRALHHLADELH